MHINYTGGGESTCGDGMICMSLEDCADHLRNQQNRETDLFFGCNGPQVCCPHLQSAQENKSSHVNMRLLPLKKCGHSSESKITGGQNAALGQFPWMALLGARLSNGSLLFICGGTLISDQYVLTAAHCLQQTNAVIEIIRLGEHNLDTIKDCEEYCADPVQDYEIEEAISHKEFNLNETQQRFKNDIALIRLKNKVHNYTDSIRPICLPFDVDITGREGKKYQIAGWGKTDFYNSAGSPILQFATVNSVLIDECNNLQAREVRNLTDKQLCSEGNRGEDPCKGDSGGPLMEVELQKARIIQVGIVSFGPIPCANSPSVYTKVSAYLDWILDHISE